MKKNTFYLLITFFNFLSLFSFAQDTTPPVFENNTPRITILYTTAVRFYFDVDEESTIYYMVTVNDDSKSNPTSAEVKSASGPRVIKVSGSHVENIGIFEHYISAIFTVDENVVYNLYVVGEDTSGNLQTAPVRLDFVEDTIGPTFDGVNSTPSDDAINVLATDNLIIDFNEDVSFGTGNITLRDVTNSVDVEVFDVTVNNSGGSSPTNGNIGITGDKIYLNPTSNLVSDGRTYALRIDNTAIDDASDNANSFIGITDDTTFNFTTVDETPPMIASVSLAFDNGYVDVTFSEGVFGTNGGSGSLQSGDFNLSITGGAATSATITSITNTSNSSLSGGEDTIRVNFSFSGTANGAETLEVDLASNAVFDAVGNASDADQTSNNTVLLKNQIPPVFENSTPTISNLYTTAVRFYLDVDKVSTIYYMVTVNDDSESDPTSAQVKSASGPRVIKVSGSHLENIGIFEHYISAVFTVDENVAYNLYIVAEGTTGNLQTSPIRLDFTNDTIIPILDLGNSSPVDNSTNVSVSENIEIAFNENVIFGTGNITIIDFSNSTDFEVFDVSSNNTGGANPNPGEVGVSGKKIYINPTSDLVDSNEYAIQIDATAIDDASENKNSFAGISDNTTMNFTTDGTLSSLDKVSYISDLRDKIVFENGSFKINDKSFKIEVYNMLGQRLKNNFLDRGVYVLKLSHKEEKGLSLKVVLALKGWKR